jgi:hypothetical protein
MEKEETKTIHIGLTEAKNRGKSLFDYLAEDVEELSDVQYTYFIGYQDGLKYALEKLTPHHERMKLRIEDIKNTVEQMAEPIKERKD